MRFDKWKRRPAGLLKNVTAVLLAASLSACVSLPPDRYGHPRSIDFLHAPVKKTVDVLVAGAVAVAAAAADPDYGSLNPQRRALNGPGQWGKAIPGSGALKCQGNDVGATMQQCVRTP